MKLQTLGALSVQGSAFSQPKPLVLLSYLALEGSQRRRHVAELFWPTGNRMKSLSMTLTRLRQGLGEGIEVDDKRVSATLPSDVRELLEALDGSVWQRASECYTGAFLEGVVLEDWSSELEEWVYTTREYLAERVQYALLNLAEEATTTRDFATARAHAERAYRLPGLSGSEVVQLKRLYPLLCAGGSPLAPEVREELAGYDATPALSLEAARTTFKPARAAAPALPVRRTSFVGRDEELAALASSLNAPNVSLLTLLGPAGVGKTRLALQFAHEQLKLSAFPDGIFFITLDALQDVSLLPSTLLSQLSQGPQGNAEPVAQLTDFLADKGCLLVLDTFEHLTEGSSLLAHLLSRCPDLKLLVTSRERLDLEEEHVLTLQGLAYPSVIKADAGLSEAVQLFKERAWHVQPHFDIGANLGDILHICRLVEGLPLGLELAASWVRLMSCADIAAEVGRSLEFLSTKARNIPERHRSLKAAFEHSWQRLSPKEQEVLRQLAVFVGGFRREAASEVAGATIPVLASLVDKSLLKVLPDGRYDRHPLLFQFTREKLEANAAETSYLQANHTAFFVNLAASADLALRGKQQQRWLERLDEELDNFRSALSWALHRANESPKGLELASSLQHFWYLRGYFREGREWLDAFLAKETGAPSPSLAYLRALCASAQLGHAQGDYEGARTAYQTCMDLGEALAEGAEDVVIRAQEGLGVIAQERGDYATARTFAEKRLALERARGNDAGIGSSLNNLGIVAYYERDFPQAHAFFVEGLSVRRRLGDDALVSASLNNLGLAALGQEDVVSAKAYFAEGLVIQKALGDKRGLALTYSNIAMIEEELEAYDTAEQLATEGLKIVVEIGYKRAATLLLGTLATGAAAQGELERAAMFWGALEHLRESTGIPLHDNDKADYEQRVSVLRDRLGEADFGRSWNQGRVMTLEQTLELAQQRVDSSLRPDIAREKRA